MAVVVDASVVIKWLVDEDDSALALALRAEQAVSAPDLVLIECRNVLLTKLRRQLISRPDAMRAESEISRSGLEFLPSRTFLSEAFALAVDLGAPIYDCIYLAVAIATDRQLVTADARFWRSAHQRTHDGDRVVLLSGFVRS